MARKITIEIIICLLMSLFLYAGIAKIFDHRLFELQLSGSPWIGKYRTFLSVFLPCFEIVTACLLFTKLRQMALLLYAGSMVVFTIYIIIVLKSGVHIPCSCGGLIQNLSWPQHIALNCSSILLTIIALLLERKNNGIDTISRDMQLQSV